MCANKHKNDTTKVYMKAKTRKAFKAQNSVTNKYYVTGRGFIEACIHAASAIDNKEFDYLEKVYHNTVKIRSERGLGKQWPVCKCADCRFARESEAKTKKMVKLSPLARRAKRKLPFKPTIGHHYAFDHATHGRLVGHYGKYSRLTKKDIELFVRDRDTNKVTPYIVPLESIIQDDWAIVQNLQRQAPPRDVLFEKSTKFLAKYSRGGGQSKVKGTLITPAVAEQLKRDDHPIVVRFGCK